MSKKPPKKLKRWGQIPDRAEGPDGTYRDGIQIFAIQHGVGAVIGYWTHLEERMIEVLEALLGGTNAPARQIFRSLRTNAARLQMMTALLERGRVNAGKSGVFEEVLAEFSALNSARNKYVHGLWVTHESGRVFLKEPTDDDLDYMPGSREVTEKELNDFVGRMGALVNRIAFDLDIQQGRRILSAKTVELLSRRTKSENSQDYEK